MKKGSGADLTGRVIGTMKVIEKTDRDRYLCQCECGKRESRAQHSLMQIIRRSQTSRCRQCTNKAKATPAVNFVGMHIGRITVTEKIGPERYLVQCDCGVKEKRSRTSLLQSRSQKRDTACKACRRVSLARCRPTLSRREQPTRTW